MPTGIIVERGVPARMRDGVTLRADVYRPAVPGRYPVLLTRHPYGKNFSSFLVSLLEPLRAAEAGYVVVVQDCRGRFSSEGEFFPFAHEAEDGYDSVEWAAALPYSDGNVGMFGASYYGFTQWAAARLRPPHLRCLAPMLTWADQGQGVSTRCGAIELGLSLHWSTGLAFDQLLHALGPTREYMEAALRLTRLADSLNGRGYHEAVPITNVPALGAYGAGAFFAELVARGLPPAEGNPCSPGHFLEEITVPSLNVGGWYDIFASGTLTCFSGVRRRAQGEGRRSKLIMAPWAHTVRDSTVGELYFGMAASPISLEMRYDITALHLRWFDYWLKGRHSGVLEEPPVKLFVMGENRWRDEQEWPLARTRYTPWYLHSRGNANTLAGDGVLSPEAPGDEPADRYTYDPADPVPTRGGNLLMPGLYPPGPRDQRPVEQRPDVLCYTSAPLSHDLEVTGPVHVKLWVASTAPDADFVARLVDVWPDGRAVNLCDGILRCRWRCCTAQPEFLEPGRAYELTIDLWATSNLFRAGHRIRLDVTSGSFPRWDRNPQTTDDPAAATSFAAAAHTVLHDAAHPSHVRLPIIPRGAQ